MNKYPASKYFLYSRTTRTCIKEISEEDYVSLKSAFGTFKKLENIMLSYQNACYSKNQFDKIKNQVLELADLDEAYSLGAYTLSSYSLISRALVDNLKSLNKTIKYRDASKLLAKYEDNINNKILKMIRNYSQHNAIPIDNVRRIYNGGVSTIEYLVDRDKLIDSMLDREKTPRLITNIKRSFEKEIKFELLIDIWQKELDDLMHEILVLYGKKFPEKEVKIIIKYIDDFLNSGEHKVDSIFEGNPIHSGEGYCYVDLHGIDRDKLIVLLDYIVDK